MARRRFAAVSERHRADTITYRTGPLVVRLRCNHQPVLDLLSALYPGSRIATEPGIVHFRIAMRRPAGIRRWGKPQIRFFYEDQEPFLPYRLDHAFPLLEWGLNWCIGTQAHQYLLLHAGTLERGGRGLILPAVPGAGKSTLSAGLAFRGWRFMSDEFGLIRPATGDLLPLPRSVPLKNASIDVIRAFAPDAWIGPLFPETRKGTVAHLRPPHDSLQRQQEPASPAWIVFPRFTPGAAPRLKALEDSLAFTRLAQNSFNYRLLGETGFRTLAALVRKCECYSFEYGDLETATSTLGRLVDR